MNLSEKTFYVTLITILIIIAIFLPIIVIQSSKPSLRHIHLGSRDGYMDDYLTPSEFDEYLEYFVYSHSLFFEIEKIAETSKFKNPIHNVILRGAQARPLIVVVSGILANDWRSILLTLHLMNDFVTKCHSTNHLLNDINLHFIPLLNPDGYDYSMSLPYRANWVDNYPNNHKRRGVNLLYNFDVDWGQENDSVIHRGPKPFSENESSGFQDYLKKNQNSIKAIFFLFSPRNDTFLNKKIVTFPKEYAKIKSERYRKLQKIIEVGGPFEFIPCDQLDAFEPTVGRIDRWVIKMTQPDPIPVIDIVTNYRKIAGENTQHEIQKTGDEIMGIITSVAEAFLNWS